MTDLPTVAWSGTFTLFGVTLHCHTLSDGSRVVDAQTCETFLTVARLVGHSGTPADEEELRRFMRWRRGETA